MQKRAKKPIIAITGAQGNIGQLLKAALKNCYKIVGFDLEKTNPDIPIDLTSKASIKLAFKEFEERYGQRIEAFIHLAAYFDFSGEASPLYDKINVQGTKNLLNVLQSFKVKRFIYTSTMLVHEACIPGELINEKSALNPKWAYPKSKLKAEKVIKEFHGKIPYVILRLAGLYDDTTCVPTLANQIARIYEKEFKSHFYSGNIFAGQAFIHAEDLIYLFKQLLKHESALSKQEIILAGERDAVSYQTLQDQIGQLIHGKKEWKTYLVPEFLAKAESWLEKKAEPIIPDAFDKGETPFIQPFMIEMASDHYALDITKAQKLIHWTPKRDIRKSLPSLIKHLKKSPKTWYEKNDITLPDWMTTLPAKNANRVYEDYKIKIRREHFSFLWAGFLNVALGFWLLTSPPLLNYQSEGLIFSDFISGILVIFFGMMSLSISMQFARIALSLIGVWLLFAPLVFWATSAAAYLNDTLVGGLIIGFSILTRPDIGVSPNASMLGPRVPPGWNFSPSSWFQRIPIIALALIGLLVSRYLTAYQLGTVPSVFEPFFSGNPADPKNGTEEIITSYVSEAWPIPDAGLGAVTYMLEILTGMIGGENRWRTMPWLVLLFGFMIIPLGIVSITFIIIQPMLLDTWCTLCLIAAAAMLLQIPYSFDEIIATCDFLWRRHKLGRPFLKILFVGDQDEMNKDEKGEDDFSQSPLTILKQMISGGISFNRYLLGSLGIGIFLMTTRLTLGTEPSLANIDHLIGAVVITITITAVAEVTRAVRFLNIIFAIYLMLSPFIYAGSMLDMIVNVSLGALLIALSIPKGKIQYQYGAWDKFIV